MLTATVVGSVYACGSQLTFLPNVMLTMSLAKRVSLWRAGETAESHEELVQFCRDFPFQRMGAFTYSEEDGTPAAEYQDQVRLLSLWIAQLSQTSISAPIGTVDINVVTWQLHQNLLQISALHIRLELL